MTQPWIGQQMEQEKFVTSLTTRSDGWTHLQNIPLGKLLLKISVLKKLLFFESDVDLYLGSVYRPQRCLYMLVGGILPGGGLLGLIFAGYVPLVSQNPYPIIVYSVAIL